MRYSIAIFLVLTIFFLGCKEKSLYTKIDENVTVKNDIKDFETLKKRYIEYWDLKTTGKYGQTYNFELPYLNLLKSKEWYEEFHMYDNKNYAITMLNIRIDKNDKDIVYIRSNFKGKYIDANVTEKWIYINQVWYHTYSQSLLPPKPKAVI